MNKNDFYKELFEKYALDEEKIRTAALRQAKTPAWKRAVSTYWKPAAGIAAALAITAGAVTYFSTAAKDPDINITVSQNSALSASQRLYDAEQSYLSTGSQDDCVAPVYVTFRTPMCYSDMAVYFSAVHDSQDIVISAVYLDGDSVLRDPQEIALFAEQRSGDKVIKAAKIFTIKSYFRDIHDLSCVYSAELGSDKLNDDSFVPLEPVDIEDDDPLTTSYTSEEAPPVSTTAFTYEVTVPAESSKVTPAVTVTSAEVSESADPSLTASQTEAPEVSQTTSDDTTRPPESDPVSAVDTEPDDDPDANNEEIYNDPDDNEQSAQTAQTTQAVQSEPVSEESEDPECEDPDTEDFSDEPVQTDKPSLIDPVVSESATPVAEISGSGDRGLLSEFYRLNVENPLETYLADSCAIVLTKNAAYFYKLGGVINNLSPKVYETDSPKLAYINNSRAVLTGVGQNGQRNILIFADIATGAVYTSDVGINLGGSEIATIAYSSRYDRYYLRSVSGSKTYIYEVTLDSETGVVFRPLFDFDGAASVAGCGSDTLWFTASADSINYSLYSFSYADGTTSLISELGSQCRVKRSPTLESFIVSAQDQALGERVSYVFDTNRNRLVNTVLDDQAQIACLDGIVFLNIEQKVYSLGDAGEKLISQRQNIRFNDTVESRFEIVSKTNSSILINEKHSKNW